MEVDSQQVVNDIESNNQSTIMVRILISKIIVLLQKDINVRIQHIYQEANMRADALARYERSQLTTMCIFEECPSFLN